MKKLFLASIVVTLFALVTSSCRLALAPASPATSGTLVSTNTPLPPINTPMPTNCPTPPSDESFQLIILNQDWQDFGRVYDSEEALPLLMNADTSESLFVISLREIEHYDWDTQVITLTKDATGALVSVLDNAAQGEEAEAIMGLRESLGWGNELERALYIRVFLVIGVWTNAIERTK